MGDTTIGASVCTLNCHSAHLGRRTPEKVAARYSTIVFVPGESHAAPSHLLSDWYNPAHANVLWSQQRLVRQAHRHPETQPALHCGREPCTVAFRTGKQYSRTFAQRTSGSGHRSRSRYRQRHQGTAVVTATVGRVSDPLGISPGHPAEPPRTERPQ